ncbi:MAG: response regulator [Acidobacteria bacterium]|nr:response regulator [Acidobacteriota bacterium]
MASPKLLIADDSVTIRKVVELTFADEGIEVTAVGSAQDAMTQFVDLQPDIVLVDVGLEGTNGYQICSMIKQDDQTRQIPVLLLVGSFEPFDQDEAERAGADGFISKPFHSIRDLVERVNDLLNGKQTDIAGGMASVSAAAPAGTPDDEDIEHLYKSSFAVTDEIEQFDTVEGLLDQDGFDDEMIETVHLETLAKPGIAISRETSSDEAAGEDLARRQNEEVGQLTEDDDDDEHHSAGHTQHVAGIESEYGETTFSGAATEAFLPRSTVDEEANRKDLGVGTSSAPVSSDAFAELATDTSTDAAEKLEERVSSPTQEGDGGLSTDAINAIVQKVIDRLSDRAVREIAAEAVPRIAEKLIREALEEDRKK